MSPTRLSCETVADLAKDILVPLHCEWRTGNGHACGATLGSWHLLEKHILIHCKGKTHLGSNWLCKLPKCSVPVHTSLKALEQHVQQSHMAYIVLPCPIVGCSSLLRLSQLTSHFVKHHDEWEGQRIMFPNGFLRPLWMPFCPANSAKLPVDVPVPQCPGSCLTKDVKPRSGVRRDCATSPSQSPTKRQRRQLPSAKAESEEEAVPSLTFDSLEALDYSMPQISETLLNVLHPRVSDLRVMSGSQVMHGTIPRQVVSQTILYKVFAKRMEQKSQ